jgi:Fe-only nitrogenase accessory protein AnfO
MKIAVYLDDGGVPISLYEPGALRVYEDDDSGAWHLRAGLPFRLEARMRLGGGLGGVKAAVAGLARALKEEYGDCRVLLSGETRGLPYSLLQEAHGFSTWRSEGDLTRQLDAVRARETEAAARKKYEIVLRAGQPAPAPVLLRDGLHDAGGGHYWIDLRTALEHASNPTSRNILIPFLAAGRFGKLAQGIDNEHEQGIAFLRLWLAARRPAIGRMLSRRAHPDGGAPARFRHRLFRLHPEMGRRGRSGHRPRRLYGLGPCARADETRRRPHGQHAKRPRRR